MSRESVRRKGAREFAGEPRSGQSAQDVGSEARLLNWGLGYVRSQGAIHDSGMQEREGWNPEAKERQLPPTARTLLPPTGGKTAGDTDGGMLKR